MEPITQALLGAATGAAVAGRHIGRRALLFGALIGMTPDIDVVLAPLRNGYGEWLYHRGTTHSLWFGFVVGPLFGWTLWRWRDPGRLTPAAAWIAMAIVALVTHPLLDGFTPYGTQLFAPFSRARFAWNGVAIVDPMYSLMLAVPVAWCARQSIFNQASRRALSIGLLLSTSYLILGLVTNAYVVDRLEEVLRKENIAVSRVRAYPTIFQPWLRHFVVHANGERVVGFHTLFDSRCPVWRSRPHPPPNARIDALLASREGQIARWFADGDLGIEEHAVPFGTRVRLEDLRYAWSDSEGRGMWGVEAVFDRDNQLAGPIRRFSNRNLRDRDIDRLWRAIWGKLPSATNGWAKPAGCAENGNDNGEAMARRESLDD